MELLNLSRQKDRGLIVVPAAEGIVQVWERPLVGCRYLVSVRGGGSMVTVGGKTERERSVILVLRRGYIEEPTGEKIRHRLAARLLPGLTLDPTPLAKLVALFADWYGRAPCLVETKDGAIVAQECQREGANVQTRQVLDRATGAFTAHIGWLTDEEGKPAIHNALQNAIREKELQVECAHVIAQLKTFAPPGSDVPRVSHEEDVWTLATGLYNIENAIALRPALRRRMAPQDGWKAGTLSFSR